MAKGDRGKRGRERYRETEKNRGAERREKENERRRERNNDRREERKAAEEERRRKEFEAEKERYGEAGEASDPTKGHAGKGDVSYRNKQEAAKKERERRDRDKKDHAQNQMRQREEFRRAVAADRASGGLGGTTEYGRAVSDEEIDNQLKADSYNSAADEAWSSGNYASWLGNSMAGAATGFVNNFGTEVRDFAQAPLDYTADVARNPFVGASLAIFAPPLALGAAGVKAADSVADYFQGEATGEEAFRQGALDVADSIQSQGLATMARFIGDPTGTTSDTIGSGIGGALGGDSMAGAVLSTLAPSLMEGMLDDAVAKDKNLSPKERRELREAADKQRALSREGRSGEPQNEVSFGGQTSVTPTGTTSTSRQGPGYSPNQSWMVDSMDMYGTEQMPTVTPSASTKGLTSGKINTKAKRAMNLMEQYPWMFDQGVLSTVKNPYAVT